jgi:hypothetical protein
LGEEVLQALVIGVDVTFVPHQVVSLDLQGMHNSCKFKVMGQVALLIILQMAGSTSYLMSNASIGLVVSLPPILKSY